MAHLSQENRRLHDPHARAAVFLGHDDANPALLGKDVVELPGELVLFVVVAPIVIVEGIDQPAGLVPDLLEFGSEGKIHGRMIARADGITGAGKQARNRAGAV